MQEGNREFSCTPSELFLFVHLHSSALTDADFRNFSSGTQDFYFFLTYAVIHTRTANRLLCVESEEFPFARLSASGFKTLLSISRK